MADYYSFDELDKTGALYRIVFGERSNGKSYAFKKKCIENWLDNGKQFALIRRFEDDIKPSLITNYFSDMDEYLSKLFKQYYPQYTFVYLHAKQGKFILYGVDDDDLKYEIGIIGYYFALNTSTRAKGSQFPNVTLIGFDEFMTNERELPDEFSRFINLISTIIRKRTDTTIFMMGNTVNPHSQILHDMNIDIRKIPQGTIKMFYTYHDNGEIANKIAVEYCRHYEIPKESEAYFRFNNPKEAMIINGAWELDEYSLFNVDEIYDKKIIAGFVFEDSYRRMYGYLTDENELLISETRLISRCEYITFTTGESYFNRKVFNWYCGLPRVEKIIDKILTMKLNGKIRFSDNLVGCDFDHFISETKCIN